MQFGANRNKGFGLRDYFFEHDMEKHVIDKEKARNIGYIRVLDYESNWRLLIRNHAVEDHAVAELKKDDPSLYNFRSILMGNFFFLLRLLVFHFIIVACNKMDGIQCLFLFILEVSYLAFITKNFMRLKYLISLHIFLSKFFQGMFLVIFQILCLWMTFWHHESEPPRIAQKIGIWCIMIAIGMEYVFLAINILYIVKELIKKQK